MTTRHRRIRLRAAAAAAVSLLLPPRGVRAQASAASGASVGTTRPIRVIVGFSAGGFTDLIARSYGEAIGQALQQPVVVENRPGASGMQAGGEVARGAADGSILWFTINATLNQNRVYFRKLPYDPDRDFAYVAGVSSGPLVLAVPADSPARSLDDLASIARRRPVTLGNFGVGSWPHMVADQLAKRHGWQVTAVPYKGEAPMWQDLIGGQLDAAIGSIPGATPGLQASRVRPLAMQTRNRSPALPDVPTWTEQGYGDAVFLLESWVGLFAPAATPPQTVQRLSDLFVQAAATPRVRQLHERFALAPPWGAAEFERRNRAAQPQWLELARELRIEPE